MKLIAPIDYYTLSDKEKKDICNGCGARDGIKVPDSILWLSISEACNIHDYMYQIGKTGEDKKHSDKTFFLNMITLIEDGWKILQHRRILAAYTYYVAVRDFGDSAFWKDKK